MINKLMNTFKTKKKTEFDIEVNQEDLSVLQQGIEAVLNDMLNNIAAETEVGKIQPLIYKYNEANQLLCVVLEEFDSKFEEITVSESQLYVLLDALEIVEKSTTSQLKLVDDTTKYKSLCKTMVVTTNMMEKIVDLLN